MAVSLNQNETKRMRLITMICSLSLLHRTLFLIVRKQSTKQQKNAKFVAKQIRNCILQDPDISEHIDDTIQFNGIGPIGDNFYGVVLTFSLAQPETYFIDQTYWED